MQEAIGKYVANMIEDGSTPQIGYGGIPDAVVMQLTAKHDLGIHTEMIGDGILKLVESGAVTNRKKKNMPDIRITTFALDSKKCTSSWSATQPSRCTRLTSSVTPASRRKWQAGGDQRRAAVDFVRAANRSRGGKAFIVLPSTARDDSITRIVPTFTPGTHLTTSKNDINYVVTEFGVAQLRGKTAKQRTQEMIAIAHPDFRAELTEAAGQMHIL